MAEGEVFARDENGESVVLEVNAREGEKDSERAQVPADMYDEVLAAHAKGQPINPQIVAAFN